MDAIVDVTKIRIETNRLVLRPFEPKDLYDFNAYARVPGVGETAGWTYHKDIDESKRILDMFIEGKKTLAVLDKASNRVIGSLGLEETSPELGDVYLDKIGRDIGYVLAKECWGQGLMVEAVQAVIQYVFDVLDYDFVSCGYFLSNHQSQRVNQKCGFLFFKEITFTTRYGTVEPTNLTVLHNPRKDLR